MTSFRYLSLAVVAILVSCSQSPKEGKTEVAAEAIPTLTVGIQISPAMGLLMVAEDKGFFTKNRVNVTLKEFTAGKFALQAFLGGSLDMAVCGEVPVTLSTLQGNKFKVISQVVERTINEVRIVAVRDASANGAEAFFKKKKRKLATSFGGGPEFFTYNFLKKYNIKPGDVELISQKPEDMPAALLSGSVDAISIFDPFARIAEMQLGKNAQTYTASDVYSELYVAVVTDATIQAHPEALKAFLRALKDASVFMRENPGDSKAIVMKYTKLDPAVINGIWDNFVFKPAINDLFLKYTAAEARWAIDTGKFPAGTATPDFTQVLYTRLLEDVDHTLIKL